MLLRIVMLKVVFMMKHLNVQHEMTRALSWHIEFILFRL